MNQPIDLDNPSFSAFAAGELDGAELAAFQSMLGDSSAQKELDKTEAMMSLLSDALSDELTTNEKHEKELTRLTDYALGELDDEVADLVETHIEDSPEAGEDLAGIEEMMGLLSAGLEAEWKSQEEVNFDVPVFTDYALGELSGSEAEEFESMIQYSEAAQKELGETKEFVSLLSEGLEKEWQSELEAPDHEFSLVEATGEENVVAVNFGQASQDSRRSAKDRGPVLISLAAVLAGLLVVGGLLRHSGSGQGSIAAAPITGFSSNKKVWLDAGDRSAKVALAPLETPFQLTLIEESNRPIDDLEIAGMDYMGSDLMVPGNGHDSVMNVALDTSLQELTPFRQTYRPDSYFPQDNGISNASYDIQYGRVGGNNARSLTLVDRLQHNNGLESVVYQGIVTFPEGSCFDVDSVKPFKVEESASVHNVADAYSDLLGDLETIVDALNDSAADVKVLKFDLRELLDQHSAGRDR